MRKFAFTIRGNTYNVKIKSFEDNVAVLEVNGSVYDVQLNQEVKTTKTPKLVRSAPVPTSPKMVAPAAGIKKVLAPLPGTVIKLKTAEGSEVKAGETLLILEAMKMENNILAEKPGTIKSIRVREGDSVLQGDLLMEIE